MAMRSTVKLRLKMRVSASGWLSLIIIFVTDALLPSDLTVNDTAITIESLEATLFN